MNFVFKFTYSIKTFGFLNFDIQKSPLKIEYIFGNISFILLLIAVILYWFDFYDTKNSKKLKSFCMIGANLSLTFLLIARWSESGHFPLSNLYESLIGLSWSLTSVHLFLTLNIIKIFSGQFKKESDKVGAIIAPTALLTSVFATFFLPPEMLRATALIPALKSNWLTMHVTVMVASYAFLLIGSLLSITFCAYTLSIKLNFKSSFWSFALLTVKEKIHVLLYFLIDNAKYGAKKTSSLRFSKIWTDSSNQNLKDKPLETTNAIILDNSKFYSQTSGNTIAIDLPNNAINEYNHNTYTFKKAPVTIKSLNTPKSENTFYKVQENQAQLNVCIWLNTMSYRILGLGFPLLTIGILSGAVWANEAWGSYWSWDPKETWALITWLVFAIYFHSRYRRSSDLSIIPATIASIGFIVIWVCYLGVNLLQTGLHSYGWFSMLLF